MDLSTYIRDVPDFPKEGILFKDITPLLKDRLAFSAAVDTPEGPVQRPDLRCRCRH